MARKPRARRKSRPTVFGSRPISTPEGECKLSAVILQLADPLMKEYGDSPEHIQAVLGLTVMTWNLSMVSVPGARGTGRLFSEKFTVEESSAMKLIDERRRLLFPDIRAVILDYQINFSGGRLSFTVTSAPMSRSSPMPKG